MKDYDGHFLKVANCYVEKRCNGRMEEVSIIYRDNGPGIVGYTQMRNISFIPDDLILNIIVRLPVKYVIVCRSVKRKCNELTSTIDGEEKADIPFSSPMVTNIGIFYLHHSFRLKNVYDGIICISNEMDILLVNPSTRESQRLPFSTFSYPCADSTDSYVLGVWFDGHQSNSNQPPPGVLQHYKVFRAVNLYIRYNYRDRGFEDVKHVFEIYDSRENCWRKSKEMYKDLSRWYNLLLNGVFHLSIDGDSLITLDAKSEILGHLPLPSEIIGLYMAPLFNLRGYLALLVNKYDTSVSNRYTDIWLMNEYGVKESWTKQYTINFDEPLVQHLCKPITFWKYMDKEEEEDELFIQNVDGKLISINLVTNKITNFELYGIPSSMMIVPYIETLLTLK
ncbi:F-box protein CPR1-like [Impatiens glandulifera]|uniref:F-box protein CPR1-like n=1 Tax=Impatiens glandulifera TaxID=253017 RepID=UPI001FB04B2A|nr:F-box protein CPR1-like [Impatiens glandulifera]